MKKERKTAMLQLPIEVHQMLKEYCKDKGFMMSGFVSALIRQKLAKEKENVRN